jgi:hypothetical protein
LFVITKHEIFSSKISPLDSEQVPRSFKQIETSESKRKKPPAEKPERSSQTQYNELSASNNVGSPLQYESQVTTKNDVPRLNRFGDSRSLSAPAPVEEIETQKNARTIVTRRVNDRE